MFLIAKELAITEIHKEGIVFQFKSTNYLGLLKALRLSIFCLLSYNVRY